MTRLSVIAFAIALGLVVLGCQDEKNPVQSAPSGDALQVAGNGQTTFRFVSISVAGATGTPESPQHRFAMNGNGEIGGGQVVGGGSFFHFLFGGTPPLPLVASGTWRAKRLVSFNLIGSYGVVAAGIAELDIELVQTIPSPAVIPARLEIVCNIPGAGLLTGEEEGFILTIPHTHFGPNGTPFVPQSPAQGLSIFTTTE